MIKSLKLELEHCTIELKKSEDRIIKVKSNYDKIMKDINITFDADKEYLIKYQESIQKNRN